MENLSQLTAPACLPSYLRLLAGCAALSLAPSAYAVCVATSTVTCLADQPIQSTSVVKPNVMFVLDNSGSMVWDIMSVDSALSENANRTKACRKNFQYNTVYYNPNIDYTVAVPKNALNVSMGSQSFTTAKDDPFTSASTKNLSTSFCAVSARCSAGDTSPDLRPQNAYYYKKIAGPSGPTCDTTDANYVKVRVGIDACTVGGDVTVCAGGTNESINFANWYSYNRSRILMMKSGMSTAFATIDDKIRVGFHTINNPNAGNSTGRSLNIDDFAATQKNNWYNALWSIAPGGGTPLQIALARVGNYYANAGTRTGLSGDPVQYSCQKNFAVLSTDGYWNGGTATGTDGLNIGDMDKTVPSSMPIREGSTIYSTTDTGLSEGDNFPRPYYEGTTASSATLADVAMYYWVKDLRTSALPAPDRSVNNVSTTASDPAYWQHMNTYTIGLGVNGSLTYPEAGPPVVIGDLPALTSGTKDWPVPAADSLSAVDDLWHAAVNGRGQYYRATDPTSLSNSLNAALRAVTDTSTFGVGPASSTNDFKSPDQSDYTTYATSYRIINWSGDVKKYALDRATGLKTGGALWSAAKRLDTMVNTTGYAARNIVTRTEAGAPVDFTYSTLSPTQQTALCYKVSPGTGPCVATAPDDASLVNYLRGDATWEGTYGIGASRFRDRHDTTETTYFRRDLIGTIVNAQPAYVAVEQEIYQDAGYEAFKKASKTRSPTLYVGANDGMMHALNAASGDELWAYVPSFVIPTATDENGREKGLRALSYQDSGAPAYNHHFYLDGPLEVGAVDFNRTGGSTPIDSTPATLLAGVWRNILVGGLGKGGKGYYALDVTAPASTLAAAKSNVLWEFPSAADSSHAVVIAGGLMGYSFGRPIITKTNTWGWVVMLPSGYNNSDGYGYVFVLNAKTGNLLETLRTTTTAPGMAHITMLAKSNNKYALQVYGGDLNGSVWRFEFAGLAPPAPRVSQIFSSSSSTPISTEVNVSIDGNNGDRWIFFGTGEYLDVPDRGTTGTQYLVALRDGTLATPRAGAPVALTTLSTVTDLLAGVPSAPSGWRYAMGSLPDSSGERIAFKPVADLRTVVFASLIPTTNPCSPGIVGNAYALEYSTGASRLMSGTTYITHYPSPSGISSATIQLGGKTSGSSGKPQVAICGNDGNCITRGLDPRKLYSGTRHVGWRELLNDY